MIFPKKCLGCPPFLGCICWPKVVGALLLLSAPLTLLSFQRPWCSGVARVAFGGQNKVWPRREGLKKGCEP